MNPARADNSASSSAAGGWQVSSWVGNSFGGANDKSVQPGMQGIWVAGDGTVYGEEIWNEAARELRGYRDGQVFGGYTFQHDNDIPNGGMAVTGDAGHVYAAVRIGNSAGVMRYDRQLNLAPFAGGVAPQGAMLTVNPRYEYLTGLAAGGGRLYVADPQGYVSQQSAAAPEKSVIRVYDTSNLGGGQLRSFTAPRARGLAVDGDGDLWVLEQGDGSHPAMIVRYTPSGQPTGQVVSGVVNPTAITVDTSGGGVGRLLVTDDGPDQNVKIFTGLAGSPSLAGTFGVTGGVLAGPVSGAVGPDRFNGPNGVGVDAAGNIYVANDGTPNFSVQGYGQGTNLEAYQPNGALLWQVYGQKYNTAAGIDPDTGTDVYTAFDHYHLDLSKPAGQQYTRIGWTLNKFKYPYDPRIQDQSQGQFPSNPTVRTLAGHKFLFMGNGMGDALNIFRFNPPAETAIPSASINNYQAKASPVPGEFIWRDANGDGSPYGNAATLAAEYSSPAAHTNIDVTGWYVDSKGDIWQTTRNHGIREFPFGGLDSLGNPIYSYTTMRSFPAPAPFTDTRRLSYDPATDTLILTGYTTSHPTPTWVDGDYKFSGSTLAAYPHFTATPHPTAAWTTVLPYTMTPSDATHKPITLSVAGHYAFIAYFTGTDNQTGSDLRAYNTTTGQYAGSITPSSTIGSQNANTDMEDGTTAYQAPSGAYLILNEDDVLDKIIMYEWAPPALVASLTATGGPSPGSAGMSPLTPHVRLLKGGYRHYRHLPPLRPLNRQHHRHANHGHRD